MRSNPLTAGLQSLVVVVAIVTTSVVIAQQAPPISGQQAPPSRGPAQQPNPIPRTAPIGLRPRNEVAPPAGQAAPPVRPLIVPPEFQLTPEDHAVLQMVLRAWEKNSSAVDTMSCNFTRWEIGIPLGGTTEEKRVAKGEIRYAKPDRGSFFAQEQIEGPKDHFTPKPDAIEHWVCDGKAIYEFKHQQSQLVEHRLPPEMQGKAITDGPLPFLFGAKADLLERRYFLKIATPEDTKDQIWIRVAPKYQIDAANFSAITVILDANSLSLYALESLLPNGKTTQHYVFQGIEVNSKLQKFRDFFKAFSDTATPRGWERVVDEPPVAMQQPSTVPPPQAQRQPVGQPRR